VEVKGAASNYDPRRDDTASKTVLNAEEIRKYGDDNIYDVLKRAPGVTVTGKTLRMRGLGAGYTQILVNGDRPPPGFNMDTLTPDQIERIEIIRAASAEYSMQAIAGTINIVLKKVTAKAQHDLRLSAFRSQESRNLNAGGTWADKKGNLSYFLNAFLYGGDNAFTSRSAERFTLPSGEVTQAREQVYGGSGAYRGAVLYPRLSWKLDERRRAERVGRRPVQPQHLGRRIAHRQPGRQLRQPGLRREPAEQPGGMTTMQGEIGWIAKLAGGKLDLKVSAERNRNHNDSYAEMFTPGAPSACCATGTASTAGTATSLRGKYTRSLFDGHSLTAGLDTSVQESEQTRDRHEQLNQDAPTRIIETFAPKLTRLAGFAQDEWSIDKQLSVYLGARWEGVQTDSEAAGRRQGASRPVRAAMC
jgi:outer membrane receptor for ferrienterochelin and colicins